MKKYFALRNFWHFLIPPGCAPRSLRKARIIHTILVQPIPMLNEVQLHQVQERDLTTSSAQIVSQFVLWWKDSPASYTGFASDFTNAL